MFATLTVLGHAAFGTSLVAMALWWLGGCVDYHRELVGTVVAALVVGILTWSLLCLLK